MSMDMLDMDVLRCDGRTAESVRRSGTALGHYVPAAGLTIMALHIFIGAAWRYALAERDASAPRFIAHTWEPLLPFLPWKRWQRLNRLIPFDPIAKATFSAIMSFGFFRYQDIVCPDGVRIGRIVGQHVVEWAHVTLCVAFLPLGFIELAALRMRLPQGTQAAAVVMAHGVCITIFMHHQKHEVLDQMSHGLVGYSYLAAAICGMCEISQPTSFMAFASKIYFHLLGSIWLGVTGYIVFGGSTFWRPAFDGREDVTPAMFVSVVFAQLMIGLFVFLLLLYGVMDWLAAWRLRNGRPVTTDESADYMGGIALTTLSPGGGDRKAGGGSGVVEESQGLLDRSRGDVAAVVSVVGGEPTQHVPLSAIGGDYEGFGAERRKGAFGGRV